MLKVHSESINLIKLSAVFSVVLLTGIFLFSSSSELVAVFVATTTIFGKLYFQMHDLK